MSCPLIVWKWHFLIFPFSVRYKSGNLEPFFLFFFGHTSCYAKLPWPQIKPAPPPPVEAQSPKHWQPGKYQPSLLICGYTWLYFLHKGNPCGFFKKTCCCVQLLASPQDTNNLRIPTYLAHPVQSTVYSDLLQVGHNGPSGVLSSLISMVPAVLNREVTLFHLRLVSAADTVWGQRWSNIRRPESQTYRVGETDSSGPRNAEAALGDNVWGQIKILFLQSTAHTVTR